MGTSYQSDARVGDRVLDALGRRSGTVIRPSSVPGMLVIRHDDGYTDVVPALCVCGHDERQHGRDDAGERVGPCVHVEDPAPLTFCECSRFEVRS
jgi:hypothetical protein